MVFWKPDVSHLEVGETLHVRDLYLLNLDNQIKSVCACYSRSVMEPKFMVILQLKIQIYSRLVVFVLQTWKMMNNFVFAIKLY